MHMSFAPPRLWPHPMGEDAKVPSGPGTPLTRRVLLEKLNKKGTQTTFAQSTATTFNQLFFVRYTPKESMKVTEPLLVRKHKADVPWKCGLVVVIEGVGVVAGIVVAGVAVQGRGKTAWAKLGPIRAIGESIARGAPVGAHVVNVVVRVWTALVVQARESCLECLHGQEVRIGRVHGNVSHCTDEITFSECGRCSSRRGQRGEECVW
ncbi:MAG: hypothetical protein BYD32DRAFT_310067 [Podila humilis]|nr:MAG: hypothetical protein BYD32DRAFT_310067 [Podila humilis]